MKTQVRVLSGSHGSQAKSVLKGEREVGLDQKPRSVYELITRTMLEEMREDVREVKGRVNTLLWLVTGALLVELLMRVVK